jgi:hypothetical protein
VARTSSAADATQTRRRLRALRLSHARLGRRGGVGRARTSGRARALVVTALALAMTGMTAAPSSASPRALHRHPTSASTTTNAPAATTTVPSMPEPVAPPPAPEDNCVKGTWPATVQGRPASFLVGGNRAYLWHDADGGWALRVTHAGPRLRVVFSGSLYSATGQFIDVAPTAGGGNDIVYETADKHTVYFRFVDYGLVDGLNFATECAKAFTVSTHLGSRLLPAGDVYLGAGGVNPAGNPFRVERVRGQGADAGLTRAVRLTTSTTVPVPPVSGPTA